LTSNFSLDPRVDRERFLQMAEEVAALAADWFDGEPDSPVLARLDGPTLRKRIERDLPRDAGQWDEILDDVRQDIMPGLRRNGNPGFLAYVSASAEPVAALADLLVSALNQNVTAWRSAPAAVEVERQVIGWLGEAIGYTGAAGILVSGGSAANLQGLCLAVARTDAAREQLVVYVSEQTHFSIAKSARVLGIGHVRCLETDSDLRLRGRSVAEAIAADRAAGLVPCCIAASVGTTNSGAIDALDELCEVAASNGVWLHIDGAYGAPALMLERYRSLRSFVARADSISIDPHKWCYAPLDVGCLLTRHAELQLEAFSADADYVRVEQTESIEAFSFFDRGLELSRRFRALKLWMMLRYIGFDRIGERIEEEILLRERFDAAVQSHGELELLASGLSVSCFRYRAGEGEDSDDLNREILESVLESGRFLLSPTRVRGMFALRICVVNFRTDEDRLDELVSSVGVSGVRLRG